MKTAIDFLIEWTENVNWKKHLLNAVMHNKEVDIDIVTTEIIDIVTNSKTVELLSYQSLNETQTKLYIQEIRSPENINALCPEAGCELGKNLNVFYGENGSGKSSYVKVFRKLAENFHTNEKNLDVMSNIYTTKKTPNEQTITVCYSSEGKESCVQCVDINIKHLELSKINVFDSSSVMPLLNSDLTFSVLPQGLNYFSQLTELVDLIKAKIQELVANNQLEQNRIFIDSSNSIIEEDITTITSKILNVSELDEYIKTNYLLPEDIDMQIESIDNKIRELQSINPIDLIRILDTQKTKLGVLKNSFELLSNKVNSDNISTVNNIISQYDELIDKEENYNKDFGTKVHHLSNVNSEWINFITTAREYYKTIGMELPHEKSQCIFCGQTLEKQQIDLIDSCFHHINSEFTQKKKEVERKLQSCFINEMPVSFLTEDEKLFSEDKKSFIEKLKTTINLVDKNIKIFKENIEIKKHVPSECIINFEDIIKDITKEVEDIEGRYTALGKSNQEINELIVKVTSDKNRLIKIKKVNESKENFQKWYEFKNRIDTLNQIKAKFTTTTLSTKSRAAFNEIVANDYISIFNDYCGRMGVSNVSVSLTSKKGQTKRGKYIVREDIRVTEIMSEGEQKAIALAEFATDLKIRNNNCTTLFDDPVTSFDYKRAEKIADLIYEMSRERQVIVFTHNIMFYYYLYNCSVKENNNENKFFKVDEFDRDNKGLISVSAEGRLETLSEITKKIKNAAQKISSKSCLGDDLEQILKATYSNIRTWCELIVEEGFLKKLIRRYEPNIMFNPVKKITPEFLDYIPAVSDLFEKSCRYMLGHSQPTETQNVKASREEFAVDFIFIIELTDKYKS